MQQSRALPGKARADGAGSGAVTLSPEDIVALSDGVRRSRRRIAKLAGTTYLVAGLVVLWGVLVHQFHNAPLRIDNVTPATLFSVLALAATLTVALHVGIYNLEKDKDETAHLDPDVLARFWFFDLAALISGLLAAVVGLLAFLYPTTVSVVGLLTAFGSVVVVLLACIASSVIPRHVTYANRATDIYFRLDWTGRAARYWGAERAHGEPTVAASGKAVIWGWKAAVVLLFGVRAALNAPLGADLGLSLLEWIWWALAAVMAYNFL